VGDSYGLSVAAKKTQADIIAGVYRNNFDVASVAPLVLRAAERGDALCLHIVNAAAEELAGHVTALLPKLQASMRGRVKALVPIALIGGLIANDTLLSRLLRRRLDTGIRGVTVIRPMTPPVYGAVLMALARR
jgi:N-acetylglucosamine kinase-like BadF-type ATPase